MACRRASAKIHDEMSEVIHDLCQPLTTLRCRLELALMQTDPEPDMEELREVVTSGLHEVRRIFKSVDLLRELLAAEKKLRT